jgi:hypothetical protein
MHRSTARFTKHVHRLQGLLAAPLSVVALCLAAIRPWFKLQAVCSDDFGFHLLRLVQLDTLLRQGVLYSRWAPDMALGYGYPFFNFYAPLSYYIAEIPRLLGLGLQTAVIATFALATIGAGLAAYRLARDHFSPRSSLVAAVAYAYAPYLAYDAYFRANLAETVAWVFPPLALWAIGRLARRGERRYLAYTVLAYAATVLTHNVFALIFSPLLAAYGLATVLAHSPTADAEGSTCPPTRSRLAITGSALLLGLGAAAFFWLPALAERSYVHSDRLLVPPVFVYWNNFIDLQELIAAPRAIHPDLLNPSPPRALGLIPVLLGVPALVGLRRFRDRPRRVQIAFFAAALAIYAWLTTASSQFVWDNVPLLEYVQFPWRLLGPAALCLAMLIAAAAELLPANRWGSLLAAAAIALLVGGALFWLEPRYCSDMEAPTSADIAKFELATHTIGTTAKGEYLPRTVAAVPEDIASTALDPADLPAGTTVARQGKLSIGAELTITATHPFTAVYNGFHYPGWQVKVDGDPVPTAPDTPHGRITFHVPEGRHRVSIRLRETMLRLGADGISLACLVLTVGLLVRPRGMRKVTSAARVSTRPEALEDDQQAPPARHHSSEGAIPKRHSDGARTVPLSEGAIPMAHQPLSEGAIPMARKPWAWAGWGLAILAAVALLHRVDTPLRRPGLQWTDDEGSPRLPNLDVELNTPFEGGLTLLGFNRERTTVSSGDRLRLDLFWTAREPPPGRYKRAPVLIGPEGLRWNPKGTLPPRGFREPPATYTWPVGNYVQDSHYVETEPGTPPGTYDLYLTLFEQETLAPKRILETAGQPGPPELSLGQITVTRPRRNPDPADVSMQHRVNGSLGPLTLLGINLDRNEAAPGDPFMITMFWLADETPTEDMSVRLALLTADGSSVAAFDLPPTLATHPTSTWRNGDLWRGQHTRYLPAALEDGAYTWRLTLHTLRNRQSAALLPAGQSVDLPPTLHVTAPAHTFTPPPVDVKTDARLGDIATLMGASLEPGTEALTPGTPLTVTLVWRAEAETHTSYRVFLHLLDSDGTLVAQSDSIPANWTRPTTGWLPDEYITDVHVLALPTEAPPDTYSLSAGLYEPSGTRLTRPNGSDFVSLTTVTIGSP